VKGSPVNIAVFASGSGTNAENLARYFSGHEKIRVNCVLSNNPGAGVIERMKHLNVPCHVFGKNDFYETDHVLNLLQKNEIDWIVLAGFLWLVPGKLVRAYENRIINIHPALLPGHGGKGFYGKHVHQSVIDSGAILSGITIHFVNEKFDDGEIIFQAACHVSKADTAPELAAKIHELEYRYFPVVVEKVLMNSR